MAKGNVRLKKSGETYRPNWYGRFDEDNKEREINLNVPWTGTPPGSGCMRDPGDATFERSREKAEAALAAYVEEVRRKGRADHLTERLIESKTGRKAEYVRLDELPDRWTANPRDTKPGTKYLEGCAVTFRRFAIFVQTRNRKTVYLYQITPGDTTAWLEDLQSNYTRKTYREYFGLLRRAFSQLLPPGSVNPFPELRSRTSSSQTAGAIHRKPFNLIELQSLFHAARADTFLFPLVVCAACTGMRRGDVCNLRWDSVDLVGNMITVKASKTGGIVEMPIFPPLRSVFDAIPATDRGAFVFPAAREMLQANPTGLTHRFKRLVTQALAGMPPPPDQEPRETPAMDAGDVAAIKAAFPQRDRHKRILEAYRRHLEGDGYKRIAKETGIALGTVSEDIRRAVAITGKRYQQATPDPITKKAIRKATQTQREIGHNASVRDWHALRATWVTLALSAGCPMEMVRRVTGHTTVEIVLQHYFRPDREQFRAALTAALPDVLTGGATVQSDAAERAAKLAALVDKLAAGTATDEDKASLRTLASAVK